MSLLDSIKSKKKILKKTDTIVTQLDGKVYKETKNNLEIIGSASGFVIDTKPDKIPAKIVDNLYLGSQDCCDIEVLKTFNIKSVLSIGINAPEKYPNIMYKFVNCLDLPETNINNILSESVPFIQSSIDNNKNILVHCNAGVSRSTSVIIGFLILNKGYTYSESYDICKTARGCIKPNEGFEKQLKLLRN